MSSFDHEVETGALQEVLQRLRTLGLVDGDVNAASAILLRLIGEAMERGERNQENLVLYAMGRFQTTHSGARDE